jgi:acetaldehyde dehydrogenase/alcohol dehydrogenase
VEIAEYLGLGGATKDEKVANLIAWVDSLKKELEIPASIQEAGVNEAEFLEKLDSVAIDAFDDQCTGANPRYPLIEEFRAILLDSFYGRSFVELTDRTDAKTVAPLAKPAPVVAAKAKNSKGAVKAGAEAEEETELAS